MSGRRPVVPLHTRIRRTGGQLTVTGLETALWLEAWMRLHSITLEL
jgi:aryl carrier-like protein